MTAVVAVKPVTLEVHSRSCTLALDSGVVEQSTVGQAIPKEEEHTVHTAVAEVGKALEIAVGIGLAGIGLGAADTEVAVGPAGYIVEELE